MLNVNQIYQNNKLYRSNCLKNLPKGSFIDILSYQDSIISMLNVDLLLPNNLLNNNIYFENCQNLRKQRHHFENCDSFGNFQNYYSFEFSVQKIHLISFKQYLF